MTRQDREVFTLSVWLVVVLLAVVVFYLESR